MIQPMTTERDETCRDPDYCAKDGVYQCGCRTPPARQPEAKEERDWIEYWSEQIAADVWDRPSIETRDEFKDAIASTLRWFNATHSGRSKS